MPLISVSTIDTSLDKPTNRGASVNFTDGPDRRLRAILAPGATYRISIEPATTFRIEGTVHQKALFDWPTEPPNNMAEPHIPATHPDVEQHTETLPGTGTSVDFSVYSRRHNDIEDTEEVPSWSVKLVSGAFHTSHVVFDVHAAVSQVSGERTHVHPGGVVSMWREDDDVRPLKIDGHGDAISTPTVPRGARPKRRLAPNRGRRDRV